MSAMAVPLGVYLISGSRVRFPMSMTLLRLAMVCLSYCGAGSGRLLSPRGLFRLFGAELLVVLAVNVLVEGETGAELIDGGGLSAEDEVHIKAALERAGGVA